MTSQTKTPKVKPKTRREKSISEVGHYITNSTLLPILREAKELGEVTPDLIMAIKFIATRYSKKANFVNYSFREDMVSSAVLNLCNNNNALKFDMNRTTSTTLNPFSYYTTAIYNSFLQYILEEKKQNRTRDLLRMDAGANPSFNFLQDEKSESAFEIKESDEFYVRQSTDDEHSTHTDEGEVRYRYQQREPGKVVKLDPKTLMLDEKGNYIIDPSKVVETKTKRRNK